MMPTPSRLAGGGHRAGGGSFERLRDGGHVQEVRVLRALQRLVQRQTQIGVCETRGLRQGEVREGGGGVQRSIEGRHALQLVLLLLQMLLLLLQLHTGSGDRIGAISRPCCCLLLLLLL